MTCYVDLTSVCEN